MRAEANRRGRSVVGSYVAASEQLSDGSQGHKVSIQYFILSWLSITTSASSNGGSEIDLGIRRQY